MRSLLQAIPRALEPGAFRSDERSGRFRAVECQTCYDRRWVTADAERRTARPCPDCADGESIPDEILRERLRSIGMLTEDIEAALAPWDPSAEAGLKAPSVRPSALRLAARWAEGNGSIATITLLGVTGSGKTKVSGECIVEYIRHRGRSPLWINVDEATRDAIGLRGDDRRQVDQRIYDAGLVVFDDAGAGRDSISDIWSGWVRGRYQRAKPSIVNANASELGEFDARTESRLRAGIHGPVAAEDYRAR